MKTNDEVIAGIERSQRLTATLDEISRRIAEENEIDMLDANRLVLSTKAGARAMAEIRKGLGDELGYEDWSGRAEEIKKA